MGLNPLRWKTRNLGYGVLTSTVVYIILIHKWSHQFVYEDVVPNANAEHVWEFVADFSNMLKLNTIIDGFKVVDETGNYDHWKYSVEYTEHLRHLPMIQNTAMGHYSVKKSKTGYVISSEHRTCFLPNLACLDTTSEFIFTPSGQNTLCKEIINYQCPLIFAKLCRKEILHQRQDIMKNLKSHFGGLPKSRQV